MTTTDTRRELGALGEQLARRHFEQLGYELIEANFRTRFGELDIVARGEGCLVFCEVKTRVGSGLNGPANPLDAIGLAKRRRLRMMAGQWLMAKSGEVGGYTPDLRFDAIGINLSSRGDLLALEHIEDAF
ncbi:MAG: YraN family protein [Thermoleophilaceae bacterium]|nr:YraN family protein [Thermoleophilaceae bacterium]